MSLFNKNVVVGVTGGIAAYKSAQLVRDLQRVGAQVRVIMTEAACRFITPLTFQALTKYPVVQENSETVTSQQAMPHIDLARWADVILIAPATANIIGELAVGLADDILTATCLAAKCPLAVAPAMNRSMWEHTAVRKNIAQLKSNGVGVLGPATGVQACGDEGLGRMLEPQEIIEELGAWLADTKLAEVRVLITAGPTREPLDPVRYLSNRSSGKMGFALAHAALVQGANVTLVSGPVHLDCDSRIKITRVETALQMHAAVQKEIHNSDIFIATAAVADYRPEHTHSQKIKKSVTDSLNVCLVANPDIVLEAKHSCPSVFTVGFAAETEQLRTHAQEKLERKGLDVIIANDISGTDTGMESDYNQVDIIWDNGSKSLQRALKTTLAENIIAKLTQLYAESSKQNSNVRYLEEKKN